MTIKIIVTTIKVVQEMKEVLETIVLEVIVQEATKEITTKEITAETLDS